MIKQMIPMLSLVTRLAMSTREIWQQIRRRGRENGNVSPLSRPRIFAHHHPLGGRYARDVETKYVRLSTKLNLEALLRGDAEETLVDQ
jgi:hypothetical protein